MSCSAICSANLISACCSSVRLMNGADDAPGWRSRSDLATQRDQARRTTSCAVEPHHQNVRWAYLRPCHDPWNQ
jgi:hypothetical protein